MQVNICTFLKTITFIYFFLQEKETNDLTKLCDELISNVQKGWAHLSILRTLIIPLIVDRV